MNTLLVVEQDRALNHIRQNVSTLTYNNYRPIIERFKLWSKDNYKTGMHPAEVISSYKDMLVKSGIDKKTVNKHLSAIRKYFKTMMQLGLLSNESYQALGAVPNIKVQGKKYGNRLSLEQGKALLAAPDISTEIGRRDKAILALLIGTGLRRSECVNLVWGQLSQNDNVYVIRDLVGKHGRTRSVAVGSWIVRILFEYSKPKHPDDKIFKSYDVRGNPRSGMTPQTIYNIVKRYSKAIGVENFAPHDLRRSFSLYAYQTAGQEGLKELSRQLGHSSTSITENYISAESDMKLASTFIPDLDEIQEA